MVAFPQQNITTFSTICSNYYGKFHQEKNNWSFRKKINIDHVAPQVGQKISNYDWKHILYV